MLVYYHTNLTDLLSGTFTQVNAQLQLLYESLKTKYPDYFDFGICYSYNYGDADIELFGIRYETDEEVAIRLQAEEFERLRKEKKQKAIALSKQTTEEKERLLYEKLKKEI